MKIWRLLTGKASSLLPDGRGPQFNWVWDLYNFTHSALIFAVIFGGLWLILRRPVLEMLGWALHIVMDVFTHSGLFAIRFLWPLWAVHVDGRRWEEGWALAANYSVLAAVYMLLWVRSRTRARASSPPL